MVDKWVADFFIDTTAKLIYFSSMTVKDNRRKWIMDTLVSIQESALSALDVIENDIEDEINSKGGEC